MCLNEERQNRPRSAWVKVLVLPEESGKGRSGASERVVLSSPASAVLCPPSNIPNTATEYFVPALRGKGNKSLLEQKRRC